MLLQEIEELTGKLRVSRHKVGDLEKAHCEGRLLSDKHDEFRRDMARQVEQSRNEAKKHKADRDELAAEGAQLRSRLQARTQEVAGLELTLDDIKAQLEMSQVDDGAGGQRWGTA